MPPRGLFEAKVIIPERAGMALSRERLLRPLVELRAGHIAVIQAPAGYGKTMLAAEAARESGHLVWWLSLDEFDSDAHRFLQYLALAANIEWIDVYAGTAASHETLGRICSTISDSPKRVWIVLDDIHWLDGAHETLSLIEYLALRLPSNANLLLVSRSQPQVPSLPRLKTQGRVLQLGPADLAFTEDEILSLHNDALGRPLAPEHARSILAITEGWPVAVTVVGAGSELSSSTLTEYISAEIIARLPGDLGEFLKSAVVLDTMDPASCDFVLSRSDSARVLGVLERHNVPVVRLEREHGYRLHAVISDLLRAQLRQRSPGQYRELHVRAADWLIQAGRSEEAIAHLAEAQEWQRQCELITQQAPLAYREGRWHAITTWLRTVPDQMRYEAADLPLWEARILVRFGQTDDALQEIDRCQRKCADISEATMAELEALRAAALRIKGDLEGAIVSSRKAVALAIEGNASLMVVAESRKQLGMALFARGSFGVSAEELKVALDIVDRRGDAEESAICNACLGSAMGSLGRLPEAVTYLQRACEQWRRLGNTKELSWSLNNLAMAHFQSGQMTVAREIFVEALSKAQAAGYSRAEAYSMASLADLDRVTGDLNGALREYEAAIRLASEISEPGIRTHSLAGISEVKRRMGQLVGAEASALEALANARDRKSDQEEAVARIALARVYRHKGDLKPALEESHAAQLLLVAVGPSREQMESLLLHGELLLESRRGREDLINALTQLAEVTRQTGLESFLVQIGISHRRLLEFGASRRIAGRFYHDVLRKLPGLDAPAEDESITSTSFPTVEVRSFGSFEVSIDGRRVLDSEWESDKGKELFLLLLAAKSPLARDEIIATLWPDTGGRKANAVFHSSVYRVRHALYHGAVVQSSGAYSLNSDGIFRWDVARFRELAEAPPSSAENLHAGFDLYTGPFAPGFDSSWIDSLRADLEVLFIDTASRLADYLLREGDGTGSLRVAEKLAVHDPYSESACRRLVMAAAKCGRVEAAIKAYDRYVSVLRDELGEPPPAALRDVVQDLKAQSPSLS